jgi:hypothetical protein
LRNLTTQKSQFEKKLMETEKELKQVKMQYKLSICNNEGLIKGLKQKIKDFEEGKLRKK